MSVNEENSEEQKKLVAQWEAEVGMLYDYALATSGKQQVGLLAVSEKIAARIFAETGVDAAGYFYLLDADSLRHIHKQHGGASEEARGQTAIVKQDIVDLWRVMTESDTLTLSAPSRRGLTRIELAKEVSGSTLHCVLEARTGRWRLALVTAYKRRKKV